MKARRFVIGEEELERDYLCIEREGMVDEAYWDAVNGTDFVEGGYEDVF